MKLEKRQKAESGQEIEFGARTAGRKTTEQLSSEESRPTMNQRSFHDGSRKYEATGSNSDQIRVQMLKIWKNEENWSFGLNARW
ncbi:hypothetical protein LINPERPRIM_LOCUS38571, partial [Linum perenne]